MLADRRHNTNVDLHWVLPYDDLENSERSPLSCREYSLTNTDRRASSFFNLTPDSAPIIPPREPAFHQPCTITQFLCKKLRWIDLGGQYDWTEKTYCMEDAPPFPQDIAKLTQTFFPDTKPEVAIVNLYSPGDTLSVHRDVSEWSENGLISLSLGCDAIFVIGIERESSEDTRTLAIRLRSGDAVYMCGPARHAWHGVPKIVAGTCPTWLSDWPAERATNHAQAGVSEYNYGAWRGWMSNKRINLNIRQLQNR